MISATLLSDAQSHIVIGHHLNLCRPQSEPAHARYIVWRNCRDAPSLFGELETAIERICALIWRYCTGSAQLRGCHFQSGQAAVPPQEQIMTLATSQMNTDPTNAPSELSLPSSLQRSAADLDVVNFPDVEMGRNSLEAEPPAVAVERLLREQFRLSMTSQTRYEGSAYIGAFLRGRMAEIAVQRAASGSVWDTCQPFLSLLCKPWSPGLLFALALYQLLSLGVGVQLVAGGGLVQGRRFRFTALESRGGQAANCSGPGIGSFRLMRDGCEDALAGLAVNLTSTDTQSTLTFTEPVAVNGWYFVTAANATRCDPVRFLLEMSPDTAGGAWDVVGSSTPTWTWSGAALWTAGEYPTALARGETEAFSLVVPWAWSFRRVGCAATLLAMFALVAAASIFKRYAAGKLVAVVGSALLTALNALAALLFALDGMPALAFVAGGFAAVELGLIFALTTWEWTLRHWTGFAGLAYPTLVIIHYTVTVGCPEGLTEGGFLGLVQNTGILEGLTCLGLVAAAELTRRESRRRALAIVRGDWALYDGYWEALWGDGAQRAVLEEMREFTEGLRTRLPPVVRQPGPPLDSDAPRAEHRCAAHLCVDVAGPFGGRDGPGHAGVGDGRLVHRMEQLFAQAAVLDVFLRAKAEEWARQSDGCFRVRRRARRTYREERASALGRVFGAAVLDGAGRAFVVVLRRPNDSNWRPPPSPCLFDPSRSKTIRTVCK